MRTVSIVGAGRLGCALALALDKAGYRIDNLVFRSSPPESSIVQALPSSVQISDLSSDLEVSSDIVFITVQDTEIAAAASELKQRLSANTVFHTSGSLPSSILHPLRSPRTSVGGIHPLVSISEAHSGAGKFEGAYFCIEGDPAAVECAASIVKDLTGRTFTIDQNFKPLYHAAAVMASGHLVALVDTAVGILSKAGIQNADAKEVLMPLIQSTVSNLDRQMSSEALTGTFARLDLPAFRRHLKSLESSATGSEIEIYLDLALRSLEIAVRRTGESKAALALRNEVSMAKSKSRVIK